MSAIQLRSVSKRYDNEQYVIKDLNLDIVDGEFMVFVGPSGCGKTTLLRMIAGLEPISDGDLVIGRERANELSPTARGVSMVFQSYALYPHMSVGENMGFALKLAGKSKRDIQEAVGRAAEILKISHLLERKPKALSGGQRQRVAIGRAIVRKPRVFLFDEPLSNLDAALRVQMRLELEKLHRELNTTMIYVTHDQVEAMTMGDRIAVFNHGAIEQVGSPLELYHRPVNRFVAGFLGSPQMNFLAGCVEQRSGDVPYLALSPMLKLALDPTVRLATGTAAVAGIRPEDLEICETGPGLAVRVDLVEHLGDASILYCKPIGCEQELTAKVGSLPLGLRAGDAATLRPRAGAIHLFDETGRNAYPAQHPGLN